MKIFALYTDVELTHKPPWFDGFRQKYDEPWPLHVTLKQPCFIEEGGVSNLRHQVSQFFSKRGSKSSPLAARFNQVVTGKDRDGVTVMLRMANPERLAVLQKSLVSALSAYADYVRPHHQRYEENFDPHITIARDLSEPQHAAASAYLKDGCVCEGVIREVVLIIVNEDTAAEGSNPANQTVYCL